MGCTTWDAGCSESHHVAGLADTSCQKKDQTANRSARQSMSPYVKDILCFGEGLSSGLVIFLAVAKVFVIFLAVGKVFNWT